MSERNTERDAEGGVEEGNEERDRLGGCIDVECACCFSHPVTELELDTSTTLRS